MTKVKDPVCGMEIEAEKAAATATHGSETYHFCSAMCKTKFSMNPAKYVGGNPDHSGHGSHTGNGSLGGVGGCHNV